MSPRMPSTTTTVETDAEAINRLAAQARDRGIEILVYPMTNEHFAPSASQPGTLHRVTMVSCDCRGFLEWGRCVHNAAVLAMYGNLPPLAPDRGPDRGPDGGGATLPVPADVVLSVVPDLSPLDRVNRAAIVAYLDGAKTAADRWELTSALLGESYFAVCGMTDRALAAWCRAAAGPATSPPTRSTTATAARRAGGRG